MDSGLGSKNHSIRIYREQQKNYFGKRGNIFYLPSINITYVIVYLEKKMKNVIAGIPLHVDVSFYLDENNKLSECIYLTAIDLNDQDLIVSLVRYTCKFS